MTDNEVEKAIANLREAIRAESFAQRVRLKITLELEETGIECNHTPVGTSWKRVRPAERSVAP